MATLEERRQFFANRKNLNIIHMGGNKLAFAKFPKDIQKKVMDRLAEKDEVMVSGLKGILPGIKIDGKQVTKDNIHEFEKTKTGTKKSEKSVKKVTKKSKK